MSLFYSAGLGGTAIPDAAKLHARYDATQLTLSGGGSVTTWTDETGNGFDLTAGNAPTYRSSLINGNPGVEFDGSSNYLDVSYTLTQPIWIFFTARLRSTSSAVIQNFYDGTSKDQLEFRENTDADLELFAGSRVTDGPSDTANHIFGNVFDGGSSEIRVDGTSQTTGDVGAQDSDGLTLGAQPDGGGGVQRHAPINVGELLIYESQPTVADVESYLSDKWGISI